MRGDTTPLDASAKVKKKYPIKHARPVGRIIERGSGQFQVWLHSHRDESGTPVRYRKTFRTLKEADARLTEKVAERNRGGLVFDSSQRADFLIRLYLEESNARQVRPQSHAITKMNMEKYAIPYIGHRRARDLRPGDFDRLYQKLREDAGSGRGLADSSLKKVHSWLRSAFAYAVRRGLLSQNPVEGATPGRVTHREIGYFTAEQVSLLLDKWEQSETGKSLHYNREGLGPVWLFLFETGVRPEELIGLTWETIGLSPIVTRDGVIPPSVMVRRVVVRSHRLRGWHFDMTKTPKSRRTIPISPTLAAALTDHRATVASLRSRAGGRWREHNLVFPSRYGEPLWEYRLRYCFKDLIERAGLDQRRYGLYCTRHTMATLLLARNVNPKVVSERLGHSSIRITLDTYSHVIPSLQVDATGVIHEAIFGGADKGEAAA